MRKRAKHNLSHYRLCTANMGDLFPISCIPVLPGDTIQHSTSALVRVSPLNTPVMHPVRVRIHHFFVPYRIVWDGWEDFITGGPDGNNTDEPPTVQTTGDKKSLLTYLGLPPTPTNPYGVNALPLRAVNKIYNEWYRDADLMNVLDQDQTGVPDCAWEKDYFTTARPWAQKGPQVTLPIGGNAPVFVDTNTGGDQVELLDVNGGLRELTANTPQLQLGGTGGSGDFGQMYADLSTATGVTPNELRSALAIQRYQENRARYGSRFTEYLRMMGVRSSDARLQRPEFLGGGSTRLNFSEVLQTTPAAQEGEAGVGDLYGHGIAGVRTNRYRKFFEEHGVVVSMMSVRPKTIYLDGAPREFLKQTKEEYYQPELRNLGQQEVRQGELYLDGPTTGATFGFQDRYDEYRQQWSQIQGDFRDTLSSWHLGRDFASPPVLNQAFVSCRPSDRIFQVPSSTAETLWIMANHKVVARRLLPRRARPSIL